MKKKIKKEERKKKGGTCTTIKYNNPPANETVRADRPTAPKRAGLPWPLFCTTLAPATVGTGSTTTVPPGPAPSVRRVVVLSLRRWWFP